MEHFRILPTDRRFKELSSEQKEMLFLAFLVMPTDEQYKISYSKSRISSELPDEVLEEMGYEKEEIETIQQVIRNV